MVLAGLLSLHPTLVDMACVLLNFVVYLSFTSTQTLILFFSPFR